MAAAVNKAVLERLERVCDAKKDGGLAERVLKIGRECVAHPKEPYRSIDHGELLYDEKGMPYEGENFCHRDVEPVRNK
jgi:antitoxin VapB